jgi:Periplasmic binding protein-like domain
VPRLASYRVDAVVSALPVLSKAAARAFAQINIPTISINTPVKNRWVTSVCSDSAGGAKAVADLFVARGARSFAFISGSEGSHASKQRLLGYRSRLRERGFTRINIATGDFLYEGGFNAILGLGQRRPLAEAIFCANDLMAIGALDALRGPMGLRVPEDVLVAGFDDVPGSIMGRLRPDDGRPGRSVDGRGGNVDPSVDDVVERLCRRRPPDRAWQAYRTLDNLEIVIGVCSQSSRPPHLTVASFVLLDFQRPRRIGPVRALTHEPTLPHSPTRTNSCGEVRRDFQHRSIEIEGEHGPFGGIGNRARRSEVRAAGDQDAVLVEDAPALGKGCKCRLVVDRPAGMEEADLCDGARTGNADGLNLAGDYRRLLGRSRVPRRQNE